jgi:hypothetical protein
LTRVGPPPVAAQALAVAQMGACDLEVRLHRVQVIKGDGEACIELAVGCEQTAAPRCRPERLATTGALRLALERSQPVARGTSLAGAHVGLDQVSLPVHHVRFSQPVMLGQVSRLLQIADRGFGAPHSELEQTEG